MKKLFYLISMVSVFTINADLFAQQNKLIFTRTLPKLPTNQYWSDIRVINPIWYNDTLFTTDQNETGDVKAWNTNGTMLGIFINGAAGYNIIQDYYKKGSTIYYYSIKPFSGPAFEIPGFSIFSNMTISLSVGTATSSNFIKRDNFIYRSVQGQRNFTRQFFYNGPITTMDLTPNNESFICQGTFAIQTVPSGLRDNTYRKIQNTTIGNPVTISGLNTRGKSGLFYVPNSNRYITTDSIRGIGFTPSDLSGGFTPATITSPIVFDQDINYSGDNRFSRVINLRGVVFTSSTTGYGLIYNKVLTTLTSSFYYYIIKTTDAGNSWSVIYTKTLAEQYNPLYVFVDKEAQLYNQYHILGNYVSLKQDRKIPYLLYFAYRNEILNIDTRYDDIKTMYSTPNTGLGINAFDASDGYVAISESGSTTITYVTGPNPAYTTLSTTQNLYMSTLTFNPFFSIYSSTDPNLRTNYTWCGSNTLNLISTRPDNAYIWYTPIGTFTGSTLTTTLPAGNNIITVTATNFNSSTFRIVTVTSIGSPNIPTVIAPANVCSGSIINITSTGSVLYANGNVITSSYQVNSNIVLTSSNFNSCTTVTSIPFTVTALSNPTNISINSVIRSITGTTSSFTVVPRVNETYRWSTADVGNSTTWYSSGSGFNEVKLTITGVCGTRSQSIQWQTYNPSIVLNATVLTISGTTTSINLGITANTSYQIQSDNWINISGNTLTVTTTPSLRIGNITVSSTIGSPQSSTILELTQTPYIAPTIPGVITVPNTTIGNNTIIIGTSTITGLTTITSTISIVNGNTITGITTFVGSINGTVTTLVGVATTLTGTTNLSGFQNAENATFEVFPNPSSGTFTIKIDKVSENLIDSGVAVYNSIGQQISTLQTGETTLPKGFYLLKYGKQLKKLVVE
ncbi:MAG: hypothetical protein EAZ53_13305 [Bacteroidetes bacterium]|nr:MAG: hypothetical protein EAZ53_13305 [Bacteroidota bacterium]